MASTQRANFSKIAQVAVLGIITAIISTTVYAEGTESGAITSVHIPPPERINNRIAIIDTTIASREAKLSEDSDVRKAKIASREAALKAKLQTFKDKRKADLTQRISTTLNDINKQQTQQMLKNLDTMSSILDKLEVILNNSEASAAIASTRQTIATTSAAVNEQAQNDYTIQVSSESTVRLDAKAKRDQLFNDLRAVRKDVIDAKQSVFNVFRIAKLGARIKEGSSSAANK